MAIKLKNSALWDVLGRRTPPPYEGMTMEIDEPGPAFESDAQELPLSDDSDSD